MLICLVMDSIPADYIVGASSRTEANSEDQLSMESNLAKCHHLITLRTYGQICSAAVSTIPYIAVFCGFGTAIETV